MDIFSFKMVDCELMKSLINKTWVYCNKNIWEKDIKNDAGNIARDVSQVGHWGNGDYQIDLRSPENIGYLVSLIRQSYEKN